MGPHQRRRGGAKSSLAVRDFGADGQRPTKQSLGLQRIVLEVRGRSPETSDRMSGGKERIATKLENHVNGKRCEESSSAQGHASNPFRATS